MGLIFFIFLSRIFPSGWSRRPKRRRNRPSCYRVQCCITGV